MSKGSIQNPKLIAKNGVYLFVRLLLVLFLSFYITRLALAYLGDEDFGINNVVGGITAIFAIVSMPLTNSIQRFLNVEFAKGKIDQCIVFKTCRKVVFILAVVMLILFETIGLYLVNHLVNIPEGKLLESNIVFQLSAFTSVFTLLTLPYQALLFAKENMKIGAYADISLSLFRLVMLIVLPFIIINHLVAYASILFFGYIVTWMFYKGYCTNFYKDIMKKSDHDASLLRNVLSFSGWNFLESVAGISTTYGTSIIINVFGGVLYNTAYGVSKQISNAVTSFTVNLMKAVEPQITSSHTQENYLYRNNLIIKSSCLSFLLIGYIYIIFQFSGSYMLNLWLGYIPLYTIQVISITLLSSLFTSIVLPFRCLLLATGDIKEYFIALFFLSFASMVIMYFLLYKGMPVKTAFVVLLFFEISKLFLCIITLIWKIKLNIYSIISKLSLCTICLLIMLALTYIVDNNYSNELISLCISIVVNAVILLISALYIVFSQNERRVIFNKISIWKRK
jgi:O-antigen/teichoic acid export membrane protein